MTTHVAVLGIDGSGKSTVTEALSSLAAARLGVRAAAAGATFRVVEPDRDLAGEAFAASGLPLAARLSPLLRRAAKRCAAVRWLYPAVKLVQMLVQDLAARRLARRYGADVVFGDGHALLCAAGRWTNYDEAASGARLVRLVAFLRGGPFPPGAGFGARLRLRAMRAACRAARALGLDLGWLPDVAVFLDVPPAIALSRIAVRGARRDPHENFADMSRARDSYLAALGSLAREGAVEVHVVESASSRAGETCDMVLDALAPRIGTRAPATAACEVLGTSAATRAGLWRRVLRPAYLAYLASDFRHGAWREPFFLASGAGRALLREGYSAGVMRRIYEGHRPGAGLLDRIFLGYPLHRAVHDRLGLLVDVLERELIRRLAPGRGVRIFSAPCGTADDLFRALERVASRGVDVRPVHLVLGDLDPHGELFARLAVRARALGVTLDLVRCDLADPSSRHRLGAGFDLALFVGLSSWIDKPSLVAHLGWLRGALRPSGTLVTDCFSSASYARSGFLAGYRASYYSPSAYAAVLETCGLDAVEIATGRDRINHVVVARRPSYSNTFTRSAVETPSFARRRS